MPIEVAFSFFFMYNVHNILYIVNTILIYIPGEVNFLKDFKSRGRFFFEAQSNQNFLEI